VSDRYTVERNDPNTVSDMIKPLADRTWQAAQPIEGETMTLADARPAVTVDANETELSLSQGQLDMMRAFFCYEFEVARLDRSSLPEPTVEVVAEWIQALETSGFFVSSELRAMAKAWASEPEALVALLVGDVDEIAARRDTVTDHDVATDEDASPSYLRAS
jgi:hypothetical protein